MSRVCAFMVLCFIAGCVPFVVTDHFIVVSGEIVTPDKEGVKCVLRGRDSESGDVYFEGDIDKHFRKSSSIPAGLNKVHIVVQCDGFEYVKKVFDVKYKTPGYGSVVLGGIKIKPRQ